MEWGKSYTPPKSVRDRPVFSDYHPLIPQFYVPEWQLDMKNRSNIIKNALIADNQVWKGHVSFFLNKRERTAATNPRLYQSVLHYSRTLYPNSSHLSRYNSGLMPYRKAGRSACSW